MVCTVAPRSRHLGRQPRPSCDDGMAGIVLTCQQETRNGPSKSIAGDCAATLRRRCALRPEAPQSSPAPGPRCAACVPRQVSRSVREGLLDVEAIEGVATWRYAKERSARVSVKHRHQGRDESLPDSPARAFAAVKTTAQQVVAVSHTCAAMGGRAGGPFWRTDIGSPVMRCTSPG